MWFYVDLETQKKFCFGKSQSRGGGGPQIGTQSQMFSVFLLVTPPLSVTVTKVQCSTVQYSTLHYITVQYSTVQYSTV